MISAWFDILIVFCLLSLGVGLSGSMAQAIADGTQELRITLPPRLGRVLFSMLIGALLIATTDLVMGAAEKLKPAARVRRYMSALEKGVFWRLVMEAT
jgi:hypothetical protein